MKDWKKEQMDSEAIKKGIKNIKEIEAMMNTPYVNLFDINIKDEMYILGKDGCIKQCKIIKVKDYVQMNVVRRTITCSYRGKYEGDIETIIYVNEFSIPSRAIGFTPFQLLSHIYRQYIDRLGISDKEQPNIKDLGTKTSQESDVWCLNPSTEIQLKSADCQLWE